MENRYEYEDEIEINFKDIIYERAGNILKPVH